MNVECVRLSFHIRFLNIALEFDVWVHSRLFQHNCFIVKNRLLPVLVEFPHHWSVNVTVLLSADFLAWILDDHDSSWPRNKFRKGIVLHLVQFCNAVYMLLCFSNAILIPFWEIFILPYPLFVRLMFYNLLVIFVFKDVNFLNRISFYLL
jgi:hypothetical protein